MPETEPLYFKEFRLHIDNKLESMAMDINDLAISTATGFRNVDFRFDTIENQMDRIKESIEKIEAHIGRYEIRFANLEKEIFA